MPSGRKQNVGPRGAQLERWACVTERSGKEVEWRWSGKQAVRERRVSSKDAQKMPHLPKFGHFRPFWNRKSDKWHSQCTPTAQEHSSGVWIGIIGPVIAECKPGQDFGGGWSGSFGHFRPFWNRKLGKWHSQCTPTARELSSGVWIVVIGPVVAECKPRQDFWRWPMGHFLAISAILKSEIRQMT